MEGLDTDQQTEAKARFAKPVTPIAHIELPPIPEQIAELMSKHIQTGSKFTKQAPQIWYELLTTDTALTVQDLVARLNERGILLKAMSVSEYVRIMRQAWLDQGPQFQSPG